MIFGSLDEQIHWPGRNCVLCVARKWLCKLEMMLLTNEGNCYASTMIHICTVCSMMHALYSIGGDVPTRPARRQYLSGTASSIQK